MNIGYLNLYIIFFILAFKILKIIKIHLNVILLSIYFIVIFYRKKYLKHNFLFSISEVSAPLVIIQH